MKLTKSIYAVVLTVFLPAVFYSTLAQAVSCKIHYNFQKGSGSDNIYKFIAQGNAIDINLSGINYVRNIKRPGNPHAKFDFAPTFGVTDIELGPNQRNPPVGNFVNKPKLQKIICLNQNEQSGFVASQAAAGETASQNYNAARRKAGALVQKGSGAADRTRARVMAQTGRAMGARPSINVIGDGHYAGAHPANAVGRGQPKPFKLGMNKITITGNNLGGITNITGLPGGTGTRIVARAPTWLNLNITIPSRARVNSTGMATLMEGRTRTAAFSWVVAGKKGADAFGNGQLDLAALGTLGVRGPAKSRYLISSTTRVGEMRTNGALVMRTFYRVSDSLCQNIAAPGVFWRQNSRINRVSDVDRGRTPNNDPHRVLLANYNWGVTVGLQNLERGEFTVRLVGKDRRVIESQTISGGIRIGEIKKWSTPRANRVALIYRVGEDKCWTLQRSSDAIADNGVKVEVIPGRGVVDSRSANNSVNY